VENWLQKSGQTWLAGQLPYSSLAAVSLIVAGVLSSSEWDSRFAGALLPGLGLLVLGVGRFLPVLIHCRVCGLRMTSCSAVRRLPRGRRLTWLQSLDACPICGDDGAGGEPSRARWIRAGKPTEPTY
jgi:hypothetical protein